MIVDQVVEEVRQRAKLWNKKLHNFRVVAGSEALKIFMNEILENAKLNFAVSGVVTFQYCGILFCLSWDEQGFGSRRVDIEYSEILTNLRL